jgi:hypothetical protein
VTIVLWNDVSVSVELHRICIKYTHKKLRIWNK